MTQGGPEPPYPLVKENSFEKWIREFRIYDKTEYEKVIKPETKPESGEIKMGEVVRLVSELTKGDAIIVTDVGQNQMFAARYYKFSNPNSLVTSGGMEQWIRPSGSCGR